MIVISLPEDAVVWYQIGWIQFAVRLCRKTKKAAQSTSSTIGGCRQSKGLRISCHQVQFLAVPCTIWVTLGKLLTISEWKFLTWKVKLITSKCWLIVRIVDNAHVAQNVLNKPRCEHICSDIEQINSRFIIYHFYFLSWWKFCDFTVLEQIEPLRVSQPIAGCILWQYYHISDNYALLLFALGSWGDFGFAFITVHICLLADAIKMEIKS